MSRTTIITRPSLPNIFAKGSIAQDSPRPCLQNAAKIQCTILVPRNSAGNPARVQLPTSATIGRRGPRNSDQGRPTTPPKPEHLKKARMGHPHVFLSLEILLP